MTFVFSSIAQAAEDLAARSTARMEATPSRRARHLTDACSSTCSQSGELFDPAGAVAFVQVVAGANVREVPVDQLLADPPGVVRWNGLRQALAAHPVDAHRFACLVGAEVVAVQQAFVVQVS